MQFAQAVSQNVMAFDQKFWLRLAARSDTTSDPEEKQRLKSLADTVMLLVEKMVKTTESQLQSSGEVVQEVLRAGADHEGEWIMPLTADQVNSMRRVRI